MPFIIDRSKIIFYKRLSENIDNHILCFVSFKFKMLLY